jgi:opacity protein-like surface antigen
VFAGAGYAWANLDNPVGGEINGRSVVLTGSNGFTANAGIGAKYYVINNLYVDVQARYRYFNRLVSDSNQNLNTAERRLAHSTVCRASREIAPAPEFSSG